MTPRSGMAEARRRALIGAALQEIRRAARST